MSAEFHPRTRPDKLWVDGGDRYMFQKGVMSLAGSDTVDVSADEAASNRFYAHQHRMMRRQNPGLVQGGSDMFWSHTADFVKPTMSAAVLPDPVGLDFRMPSEHTEYLQRQDMTTAHPAAAPWMQHSDTQIRMAVTPTVQDVMKQGGTSTVANEITSQPAAMQAEVLDVPKAEEVQAAQSAGDFRDPAFKGPSKVVPSSQPPLTNPSQPAKKVSSSQAPSQPAKKTTSSQPAKKVPKARNPYFYYSDFDFSGPNR